MEVGPRIEDTTQFFFEFAPLGKIVNPNCKVSSFEDFSFFISLSRYFEFCGNQIFVRLGYTGEFLFLKDVNE